MPKKYDREIGITDVQIEHLLTGNDPVARFKTPEDEAKAWKQNRGRLVTACREKFGMFTRPWGWWKYDAPEAKLRLRGNRLPGESTGETWFGLPIAAMASPEDFETTKGYLARHPELQTAEERRWLQANQFSGWELMGVSEIAPLDYLQEHPELLSEDERMAMREYIEFSTVAGGSGLIH